MNNVIYLDPANAITMNMLKGSIAYMRAKNADGKYSMQIDRETEVLGTFFDEVLGRSTAA